MRKKRKSGDGGFNIWRSYSDVMAGVLLLFHTDHVIDAFPGSEELRREYSGER